MRDFVNIKLSEKNHCSKIPTKDVFKIDILLLQEFIKEEYFHQHIFFNI